LRKKCVFLTERRLAEHSCGLAEALVVFNRVACTKMSFSSTLPVFTTSLSWQIGQIG
jgi:hypothetical protein